MSPMMFSFSRGYVGVGMVDMIDCTTVWEFTIQIRNLLSAVVFSDTVSFPFDFLIYDFCSSALLFMSDVTLTVFGGN